MELARRIRGKPIVAFTGAGISAASGIPAFRGEGGLQEQFPINSVQFPGAVADWMIQRPRETAIILGQFYSGFITASPTSAHLAFAQLEKQGILKHIITGNFDGLHERAGSEKVHINESKYFRGTDEGWVWIREGKVALVTGVSMDAKNGLIDYARDNGLQVVIVAPERLNFMHAQDWFVKGRAEDILPKLTRLLAT
jgi:NAD-dependent SIR2 family protein deacetylase